MAVQQSFSFNTLASKMRAEFKEKEQKAKEAAQKVAKQANMSELEHLGFALGYRLTRLVPRLFAL